MGFDRKIFLQIVVVKSLQIYSFATALRISHYNYVQKPT